jgi:iron complex outermembrane receptor protein
MKSFNASWLSLGLAALPIATATAQEQALPETAQLAEITVTAQKRAESVQDLPISVTAFTGEAMKELGVTSSMQLSAQTPGLQTAPVFGEGNIPIVSIRGVSMIDFSEHNESPSAVYVDEFYKANLSGLDFQLFDLERAEVLRGPQGTLFGRNATGGLVQYITVKPSQETDGYVDVTAGEYGKFVTEGAIGGGLTDTTAGRLSVIYSKHDGFNKNDFPGRKAGNALDMWGVRGQLAFNPNDNLSILASVQAGKNTNDGGGPYHFLATSFDPDTGLAVAQPDPPFVSPDKRRVNTDIQPALKTDFLSALLRIEYALSDNLQLVSLTGFESIEKKFNQDVDSSPLSLLATYYEPKGDEFTQELRLAGDYDNSRWVAGVYYMDYQNKGDQWANAGPDFTGAPDYVRFSTVDWDMHTKAWAVFGQYEYDFTDRLTGVIGARYGSEDKTFEENIVSAFGDLAFTKANFGKLTNFNKGNTSYNARLNLRINDDLLTYASTSRAYKAGTFNMGFIPLADVNDIPVDQEELTSYEIGFKSEFADGRARLNGAAFYYQYNDYQAFLFDSVSLSNFLFNNDVEEYGAELELQAAPWDGWDFVLGVAYLDAKLKDVQEPGADGTGGAIKDRNMVMAPKLSANALVRYSFGAFGGTAALQLDGNYNGEQYLDTFNSPAFKEGSYMVGNVRASWTSADSQWTATVFVENVTDEEYRLYAFDLTGLAGLSQEVWSRPRWAGVTVGYRF